MFNLNSNWDDEPESTSLAEMLFKVQKTTKNKANVKRSKLIKTTNENKDSPSKKLSRKEWKNKIKNKKKQKNKFKVNDVKPSYSESDDSQRNDSKDENNSGTEEKDENFEENVLIENKIANDSSKVLKSKALLKLKGARFRYINEQV